MTSSEGVRDCALCQLDAVPEEGRVPRADIVVAYVDDDLLGMIPGDQPGVLLAPRRHVGSLFEVPALSAGLLAALRLLVEEVKSSYGVDEATIVPISDLPDSGGHVCYHVMPIDPGRGDAPVDTATLGAKLADTLRRHAAGQGREQSGFRPHRAPLRGEH